MQLNSQKNPSFIQSLNDQDLHQKTLRAAENEKQATLILLEHLAEVDHRRLHLKLGYSTLWEYTHQALQFSESQASERVNSMRLMVKIPEVKQELESGKINLTIMSKLASHVRREKLQTPDTIALLSEVKAKPTRMVEKILAQQSTEPARPDRVKVVTPEVTRITIDVDDEFMELLTQAKEINGNHAASPKELFKRTLIEFVKKRELKKPPTLRAPKAKKVVKKPSPHPSRYIPAQVKTQIRLRSGNRCEYVDPTTHKRCDSKTGLQWDHYPLAFALGGKNTPQNLRQVCAGHNQLAAVHIFGRKKIEGYFRSHK